MPAPSAARPRRSGAITVLLALLAVIASPPAAAATPGAAAATAATADLTATTGVPPLAVVELGADGLLSSVSAPPDATATATTLGLGFGGALGTIDVVAADAVTSQASTTEDVAIGTTTLTDVAVRVPLLGQPLVELDAVTATATCPADGPPTATTELIGTMLVDGVATPAVDGTVPLAIGQVRLATADATTTATTARATALTLEIDVTVLGTGTTGTVALGSVSCTAPVPDPLPTPTIAGLAPATGPTGGGTPVTVTGTGFVDGTTTVTFDTATIPADDVTVTTPTTLTVTSPAHAPGDVDVTLTTPAGTSDPATYTYVAPPDPAPTILSAAPATSPTAGGAPVVVTGTGFVDGTTSVSFGTDVVPADDVTVMSPSTLAVTSPAHAAGTVDLAVSTPAGTTGSLPFTYVAAPDPEPDPPPTLFALTPATGPTAGGTRVAVTGSGFVDGATSVAFGDITVPPGDVEVLGPTDLAVSSPPHAAGAVDVTVTTSRGTSAPLPFAYVAPDPTPEPTPDPDPTPEPTPDPDPTPEPTPDPDPVPDPTVDPGEPEAPSLEPRAGPVQGDTPVLLRGVDPDDVVMVRFDGMPARILDTSRGPRAAADAPSTAAADGRGHWISLATPRHARGEVEVTVELVDGGTRPMGTFLYFDTPTAASLSPTSGPTSGGTVVTVVGTELVAGATTVQVDGVAVAQVTVHPDGDGLDFTTPAHVAGAVEVALVTPGGETAPMTFTYTEDAAEPDDDPARQDAGPAAPDGGTPRADGDGAPTAPVPTTATPSAMAAGDLPRTGTGADALALRAATLLLGGSALLHLDRGRTRRRDAT